MAKKSPTYLRICKGCGLESYVQKGSLKRMCTPCANKAKIGKSVNKGVPKSDEHKEKMPKFKPGHLPWNTGKKMPPEQLRKHIEVRLGVSPPNKGKPSPQFSGENNPNWKGGTSSVNNSVRVMSEYYDWRTAVFKRDNWTCVECGDKAEYVTAHHVKSFRKILSENNIKNREDARACSELWDTENGITLCEPCHSETDNYRCKAWIGKRKTKLQISQSKLELINV